MDKTATPYSKAKSQRKRALKMRVAKQSSRGKLVPVKLRKLLDSNIRRLRTAVIAAAKYRAAQRDVELLIRDLGNSVHHVFGDHTNCDKYFCTRLAQNERNWIPDVKDCGLYDDIKSYVNRLIFHARSLITNMSTNIAESYNAIVAKYIGGKRINYSQRYGYNLRCNVAAVSFNTKGGLMKAVHKKLSQNNVGEYTLRYSRINSRLVTKRKRQSQPTRKRIEPADMNYGGGEVIPDMSPEKCAAKKEEFLKSLYKPEEELAEIEIRTAGQGGSQLWHEERAKRLTASNVGRICKRRKTTNCSNILKHLIYNTFHSTKAMQYGIEKEPIARQQFENEYKLNVFQCGLFVDKIDCYLAASPDSLIGEGSLLEIKSPYSASKVSPREAIQSDIIKYCKIVDNKICLNRGHDYYYQIQGQLKITGRNICYFVLWTPLGMEVKKIYKDSEFWCPKMMDQLKNFYFEHMIPELVDPPHTRNLDFRNTR